MIVLTARQSDFIKLKFWAWLKPSLLCEIVKIKYSNFWACQIVVYNMGVLKNFTLRVLPHFGLRGIETFWAQKIGTKKLTEFTRF